MANQKDDSGFDFLVFIGRFAPFHAGHLKVVTEGLKRAKKLIILVGSAKEARSVRNPWTWEERKEMILSAISPDDSGRVTVIPLLDHLYNDHEWLQSVQMAIQGVTCQYHAGVSDKLRIGLIGHKKDNSSYYLEMFPQWNKFGNISVDPFFYDDKGDKKPVSSSFIRGIYFKFRLDSETYKCDNIQGLMPASVFNFLLKFQGTREYEELKEEFAFVEKYRAGWAAAPYPPTFVTVDAIVIQSGHCLLVERKAKPGQGLMALPGGFVDQHETLEDAMIRELREETRLKVPAPVLKGSIKSVRVFDNPYRSARGRTITTAFLIVLNPDAKGLPPVKGGDDARSAGWVALGDIESEKMFEDHFHIIKAMMGN